MKQERKAIGKTYYTWNEMDADIDILARRVKKLKIKFSAVWGPARGGLPIAVCMSHALDIPMAKRPTDPSVLMLDGEVGGVKPVVGGLGKFQPPAALAVTPVGGVQVDGGVTTAGIEDPGTITIPFGKTVIPAGADAIVKTVPTGSLIPRGTATPDASVTLLSCVHPAGRTVPVGMV